MKHPPHGRKLHSGCGARLPLVAERTVNAGNLPRHCKRFANLEQQDERQMRNQMTQNDHPYRRTLHSQESRTGHINPAWRMSFGALTIAALLFLLSPMAANAQQTNAQGGDTFSSQEIVDSGHVFFGSLARGMAEVVESLASRYGQPNGYILGEEASGAFFGGLRYGEGVLYTRNAGNHRVYWQGPSLGFDVGGEGTRTMMLVYNLPTTDMMYQRFPGVSGSAFLVGGLSVSGNQSAQIVVAPIRAGIGARLGINVGYIKFTRQATWNPF